MLLEVKDLRIEFATRHGLVKAVDGVSYGLDEGEILGIVGESGSGKSVGVLSILKLIEEPGRIAGGQVNYNGRNVLAMADREIRRVRGGEIGMVFQEPLSSLNPVLTIGRQLSEAIEFHQDVAHGEALARSVELLRAVGIPGPESKLRAFPHQLSGGMRQRVMIALALSCDPKILIADEPTSALDVTIAADILDLLKKLAAERGVAVLLVTHDLGIVARYVDRVIVMYAGRIMETAPVEELFARPCHPYTRGLLDSVPRLYPAPSETRKTMSPVPPGAQHAEVGCPFQPRCSVAIEACGREAPEPVERFAGHLVSCWNREGPR